METQTQIQVRVYKAQAVLLRAEAADLGNRAPEQVVLLRAKADLKDVKAKELVEYINRGERR